MTWQPPKSPYTLLQEQLWQDPWKIFVCCIFCNLTKRLTAEPYFWEVLKRWPTPEKLADADYDELVKLIQPLGLSQRRAKALKTCHMNILIKTGKMMPQSYMGSESMVLMLIAFFVKASGVKWNQKTVLW